MKSPVNTDKRIYFSPSNRRKEALSDIASAKIEEAKDGKAQV